MKKFISNILSITLMITVFSGISVFAADDFVTVELDGAVIEFDVNPQIIDGRTMVPLRKIFEEIGALVKWDNDTQTISARKSSKTVSLTIGSNELKIDKGDTDDQGNPIAETVTLEVPAQILSGRTLVPARAVSEAFGLDVVWDDGSSTVVITSNADENDSWKENTGTINLSDMTYTGEGIGITGNQIMITAGGDFTVTGTLDDGNITVSAEEKVKLRLENAAVTSSKGPCIFIENADKAYITLTEDTRNYLNALNSDDGAIYSKDNLEIKGKGSLEISSSAGHGIKASDNLSIENGMLDITAAGDGIHINDTFKMTGGTVHITSVGDGIDSESIVNISGGIINIETTGAPVETTTNSEGTTNTETSSNTARRGWREQETDEVEFEKSTKGINAEWMMCISGGEITVNSTDHAVHCADEIEIVGGTLVLSSEYAKGISGHGNVTVDGSETVINIKKSTEGLESKNVLTINDGTIDIVSTDDGINATGGNSSDMMDMGQGREVGKNPQASMPQNMQNMGMQGMQNMMPQDMKNMVPSEMPSEIPVADTEMASGNMQPQQGQATGRGSRRKGFMPDNAAENQETDFNQGAPADMNVPQAGNVPSDQGGNRGGMGGFGGYQKECLIINGGEIEIYAGDDCLDANGNLVLNGGIIKAVKTNGTITGTDSIFDPDGQLVISEGVTIVAAIRGSQGNISISQNAITLYGETANNGERIVLSDETGNTILEYSPKGSYSAVWITSPSLIFGKSYTLAIGSTSYDVTLSEQNTVIGTQSNTNANRNRNVQ